MRPTCRVALPDGPCGKPAVDYIETVCDDNGEIIEDRFYMCAEHWNECNDEGYPDDDVDFD